MRPEIVLSVISLAIGGGVMATLLKYLFAHARKHQQIDDQLLHGREGFVRNDLDHDVLKRDLEAVKQDAQEIKLSLTKIASDVAWIRNGHAKPPKEGT